MRVRDVLVGIALECPGFYFRKIFKRMLCLTECKVSTNLTSDCFPSLKKFSFMVNAFYSSIFQFIVKIVSKNV